MIHTSAGQTPAAFLWQQPVDLRPGSRGQIDADRAPPAADDAPHLRLIRYAAVYRAVAVQCGCAALLPHVLRFFHFSLLHACVRGLRGV